eukprot:CAMPEP_0177688878 /NCGR_PEP_ID=MMETSP0447-20121125/34879_1 /TAXON_ID=0 /ORGANISM="Stygamoeba regulata, Strain BSH-02190019" /LENGTH=447 /DNA_ID=CAMNT_0019199181 /DNA_START=124 /DNA_END=1467 /DNA_ORIENTATION=+
MLYQFYVLSERGDAIISRHYRGALPKDSAVIFFKHVMASGHDALPPALILDGINFFHIFINGLYFLATTPENAAPGSMIDFLLRLTVLFKDYCGVLTEEAIRTNFVLIYELLDEVLDFGYPQGTETERLKAHVFSEPIEVHKRDVLQQAARWGSRMLNRKTVSSRETDRPIALSVKKEKKRKNEIFVDLLERVTVLFGRTGEVLKSEVDGAIVMKSFLKGEPVLHLALNEDLVIGDGQGAAHRYGVRVEDMNFHHQVGAQDFERTRELVFPAPQGEFTVLNYRVSDCGKLPFRVFPFLEAGRGERSLELSIKLRADFPPENVATTVEVCVPLPPTTSSVGTEHGGFGLPGVSTEFIQSKHLLLWTIEQFQGGSERQLRLHISLDESRSPYTMYQVGPISVEFDLPMYACSGVNIRSFRVTERDPRYSPARWIRYVTRSRSYVARIGL